MRHPRKKGSVRYVAWFILSSLAHIFQLRLMKEEQERLEREERAREAKKPRHQDLDIITLGDDSLTSKEINSLNSIFSTLSRRVAGPSSAAREFDERETEELREAYSEVKIVSRAKVTQDRIYSSLYHPEKVSFLFSLCLFSYS